MIVVVVVVVVVPQETIMKRSHEYASSFNRELAVYMHIYFVHFK